MSWPKPRHSSRTSRPIVCAQALLVSLLLCSATSRLIAERTSFGLLDGLEDIDHDSLFDSDDFKIEGHITDSLGDELLSQQEKARESEVTTEHTAHSIRKQFTKACPRGLIACDNGECISPRWRCDGHYDCDDFSDEVNCTINKKIGWDNIHKTDLKEPKTQTVSKPTPISTSTSTHPPVEEITEPKFNSSQEPLMLFSTGNSIRGYWMSSRIYFDIVSSPGSELTRAEFTPPPTITQALSIFFGMSNPDQPSTASSKGVAADDSSGKARNTIVGVDMDPENKEVYWVELGKDAGVYSTTIDEDQFDLRHRRQLGGHMTIVEHGLVSPEDIALDTFGKNLYITDAGLPAIVVCSTKRSDCKIIVRDNLHKPRAIIVDSSTGWLIYTDWGDHPGIFTVSMDGKNRETLINTDVVWPNGLAADYSTNYLYWADARLRKIERIDLVTKKRRLILNDYVFNPFSLSVFENRLYWSDWSGNNIKTCDKTSGNSTKTIMRAENIYGIHLYHPNIYARTGVDQSNPCWSKRCSHMCLLSPQASSFMDKRVGSVSATCACPESMALSSTDGSTCYPKELSFVLLTVKNYVAQMFPEHIGLGTIERIIYSKNHIIHDVVADWHALRMFFFDAAKSWIYQVMLPNFDTHKPPRIDKFVATSRSTRSMIFDYPSANLYWLEPDNGTIVLCSTKTKFKTVIKKNLDAPTTMVLDPVHRVFYIATMGANPSIMRTSIQGHDHDDIVLTDDVGLPVSLHLDEPNERLYWADARHETIESVDLEFDAPHGIKHQSHRVHRHRLGVILAFTVYRDHLIWSIKNGDYLFKAPLLEDGIRTREEPRPVAFKLPPNPASKEPVSDSTRLILVDPREMPGPSPCERIHCSHACVVDAHHTALCLCPKAHEAEGYYFANETGECLEEMIPKQLIAGSNSSVSTAASHEAGATPGAMANHTTHEHAPIPQHHPADSVSYHKASQPIHADLQGKTEFLLPEHQHSVHNEEHPNGGGVVWPIVLLLLISITALVTLVSLLILYKQGRLPRQVSQLSVSFIPQRHDKDGAMLLLDSDA